LAGLIVAVSAFGLGAVGAEDVSVWNRAERIMRELMPVPMRCGHEPRERITYCRYASAPAPGAALEMSVGEDGPATSLSYDVDNSDGPQFLNLSKGLFESYGVQQKIIDQCIADSVWTPGEVTVGHLRVRCYHWFFADRVGYEIASERIP
jgi:hypothetical protein